MKHIIFFWLCFALLINCSAVFAHAQKNMDLKTSRLHQQALTSEDAEAFFDEFIPMQIKQADIAGAVIAVVKDGALVFAKGYGYADTANKTKISPESTLFRAGSISKLFTLTAVMQQVEKGKLDLDRDVNDYLDFKIPLTFDKPITLRDLMTHRAGFEEALKDLFVASTADLHPLSDYLQSHMPSRIFPAGTTPAYSNYAVTMAAYIVERVSGQNFNDYVVDHIFKPLEMHNTTFDQPPPDTLKSSVSKGYILGSGNPKPFELIQAYPAGSLSTSAVDMTHFMIMHLQNGLYRNIQVLKPETVLQMHTREEGWPNAMNAMCLGFYEQSQNGYRIIGHEGHTILFHSKVFLNLDAHTGLFISYNSVGQSKLDPCATLVDKFMDRYFPEILSQDLEQPAAFNNIQNVTGSYQFSRRSETTFLALSTPLLEATVTANLEDNTISMTGLNGLNQHSLHFREIEPMVFREVDGKGMIAFGNDANGHRIAYVNYDIYYPSSVFLQVRNKLNKQSFNFFILGFSLSVIMLTLLSWPVAAIIRKKRSKPLLLGPNEKRLRKVAYAVCLCVMVYIFGLLIFVSTLSDFSILSARSDLWLRILQIIGLIAGLGTLTVIYYTIRCWKNEHCLLRKKIWYTLLSIACFSFIWFIYYWNMLNFHLKY